MKALVWLFLVAGWAAVAFSLFVGPSWVVGILVGIACVWAASEIEGEG